MDGCTPTVVAADTHLLMVNVERNGVAARQFMGMGSRLEVGQGIGPGAEVDYGIAGHLDARSVGPC